MIRLFFTALLLACSQTGITQANPFYEDYAWEANPNYSMDNSGESIVSLKHKLVSEFYFEDDSNFVEYFLEHRVLWLNSDDRIEEYNKIYIPYDSSSQLLLNKARVISKTGEVIDLPDSKILTAFDEESGRQYTYFAFEGIEKGSFIEYYYVIRKYPDYRGQRISFQTSYTKLNTEFDVYSPENLEFKFKSYNGIPEVQQDTLMVGKLHWQLKLDELKALDDETTSAYNASRAFVVFKLDNNLANNTNDISSYGNVAQGIYGYYFPEYSNKTAANIEKFVAEATKGAEDTEDSKIRKLEYFIKTNIYASEANNDELKDLDRVISEKVANEVGLIKLYVACLKALEFDFEIVLTSDRLDIKFDADFEANNFLSDFLIYFPDTKNYLDPVMIESRYGFPNAYLTDNYGLFIKEVSIGSNKSGVGKIKYIQPVGVDKTFDKMVVDVRFDPEDLSICIVNLDRALNGYYAMYIQPFVYLAKPEDMDDLTEGFAKNLNENVDITDKKMLNGDPELFGIKPLQILIDFTSDAFVEKAGNKYLFKVGDLIGPQIQLYQEKERVLDVESEFNRSYYRTINVAIPEGYKVTNLNDINIDNSYVLDGKEIVAFHSYFKLDGNMLEITADEHYRQNSIPVELYEEYRTVINSAADFNKITLVIEPID